MFKRFNLITGVAAGALAIALSAPVPAQTTLTMATGDAIGSLRNQLGNWVRDQLEERAGELRVQHIEGPVLGNAAQITDQVIDGSLDIAGFDAAWLTPYSDFLKTTSFAFVFRGEDHMQRVFDSELMATVEEQVAEEFGIRILALGVLPARTFFSIEPLADESDFADLKIRSPQLNVWIESYQSLGANPTPVNWNEVFLALQTGLVEAGHGLPADVIANQWHLAAPHITALEDMFGIHAWFMNEDRYQSLSEAEREELHAVMDDSMVWLAERASQLDHDAVTRMLEEGGGTYTSHRQENLDAIAAEIGEDRVVLFPAEAYEVLRQGALERARELEGTADWWGEGMVDQIQAIE